MKVYRITVDEEVNNADDFWYPLGQKVFETIAQNSFRNDGFNLWFLTLEEAKNALEQFKQLPHWSDEGYPEYAPHPFIDDIYEEEFFDVVKMAEKLTDDYISAFNDVQTIDLPAEEKIGGYYNWRVLIDEEGDFIYEGNSCICCADNLIDKDVHGDYVEVVADDHLYKPEFLVREDTPTNFLEDHRDEVYVWAKNLIEEAIEEWEKEFNYAL